MRRSFGWMRSTGEELLRRVPPDLLPPPIEVDGVNRYIDKHMTYTALVYYEFVEADLNAPNVVQQVLGFLWYAGFGYVPVTKAANWECTMSE